MFMFNQKSRVSRDLHISRKSDSFDGRLGKWGGGVFRYLIGLGANTCLQPASGSTEAKQAYELGWKAWNLKGWLGT